MRGLVFELLICLTLLVQLASPLRAEDSGNREYQVKAAMIFNFAQFVEWSPSSFSSSDAPLVIAVVGANPFGNMLEQVVAGKKILGHPVVVQHYPAAGNIEACHVLFVPRTEDANLPTLFAQTAGKTVMTVGETDPFIHGGGVIRFFTENNKMRFEINPDAAQAAHLTISSKLMKLARIFRK